MALGKENVNYTLAQELINAHRTSRYIGVEHSCMGGISSEGMFEERQHSSWDIVHVSRPCEAMCSVHVVADLILRSRRKVRTS